ncbi:MAG TPA: hypothetical protein DDY86_09310 [Syntrophaceae bacterium]|nr:hypothetical protein [Syntrophaceae bacterium]
MKKLKIISWILLTLFVGAYVYAASQQTSSTTAATIISKARYYLDETAASFWADAELLSWVNDGTLDIVARTKCLEGTESVTLTPGTIEYAITSNYIDVGTVVLETADGRKGLLRKNPQSIGHVEDIGEPLYWYDWGGKLGVYPTLETGTTGTAIIYYVSRPATVTAAQVVYVPAIYDRALTLYVAAQALLKPGLYAKSGRLMSEYLAEIDRYRSDFVEKPQETEASIKPQK